MAEQRIKYAFRLVHIDNISHVNRYGFVHKDSKYAKPDYVPIGDQSIINVRESAIIPGLGTIGQCIPFYFGPRSPMFVKAKSRGENGILAFTDPNHCNLPVYSLISTCKNAGIEPRIWMEDVLRKIPYYLRDGTDLSELLPRHWAKLGTNRTDSDTNQD